MNELLSNIKNKKESISVIGLGYVGLPLALELSKQFNVIGFDISSEKINSLKNNIDITKELGIEDTIGIDLHKFEPYTIEGDIHDLKYEDNTFDLEFSNIFDHSLYPEKFISEIYRTLKPGGIVIIHIQFGIGQDKYTETIVESLSAIKDLFNKFQLIKEGNIESGLIAMNYKFIFKK